MTTDLAEREWLTADEVAEWLNCSERTLYSRRKDGTLPASKLGGLIRYRRSRVEQYMRESEAVA